MLKRFILLLTAVLVLSCSEEKKYDSKSEEVYTEIKFRSDEINTRTVVSSDTDLFGREIGVLAQMSPYSDFSVSVTNIYKNIFPFVQGSYSDLALKHEDNDSYSPLAYWDIGKYYRFRGYWPKELPSEEGVWEKDGISLSVDYTVPNDIRDMSDLLVTDVIERTQSEQPVTLNLKHQFASVSFKFKKLEEEVHITGVAFFNYYTKCRFDVQYGFSSLSEPKMSNGNPVDRNSFSIDNIQNNVYFENNPFDFKCHLEGNGIVVSNYENLLMIPQPVSNNSSNGFASPSLFVKYYTDNPADEHITEICLDAKGVIDYWNPNRKYVYAISLTSNGLTVNVSVLPWIRNECEIDI